MKFYVRLGLGAQLLVHQMIIFLVGFKCFFHYIAHMVKLPAFFNHWFITMYLWLSFGPYGDSSFFCCCAYGGERMISHDVAWMHLCLSQRMPNFISYMNIYPHFCVAFHLFFVLTLWFWWMVFKCWLMSSSLAPFQHIWFCG